VGLVLGNSVGVYTGGGGGYRSTGTYDMWYGWAGSIHRLERDSSS
jgi:hypothetical protein